MSALFITLFVIGVGSAVVLFVLLRAPKPKVLTHKDASPQTPKILFNERRGVRTAYFSSDVPETMEGMLMPKEGMMVFTNRDDVPRTGTYLDLDRLSHQTGLPTMQVGDYTFYAICTNGFDAEMRREGEGFKPVVVPNMPAALARGHQLSVQEDADAALMRKLPGSGLIIVL